MGEGLPLPSLWHTGRGPQDGAASARHAETDVHEVALAQAVWHQVAAEMAKHPGRRLTAVHVVVGALSGAAPEPLEFALGLIVAESEWPGAAVDVRAEPVALVCRGCGNAYPMDEMRLRCPQCGGADVEPVRGAELRLESLEVE